MKGEKIIKRIENRIDMMTPEPKRFRKVEIGDISHKIPQNARFGIIATVAVIWVAAIKSGFREFFDHFSINMSVFRVDLLTAVIVTVIAWLLFMSWTKIAHRINRIKISMAVKPRVNCNGNYKKRR